jgi:uncharacterized glyoxalase superfamily protein PhnB
MTARPIVFPAILYEDAPRAIAFLCDAFGFTVHAVHADGDIVHNAQLVLAGNIVMLSSAQRQARDNYGMASIRAAGGVSPVCLCVVTADPDAHHARALAAGAQIIEPPFDYPYGGRGYCVKDSEGLPWSFGTYDPYAGLG